MRTQLEVNPITSVMYPDSIVENYGLTPLGLKDRSYFLEVLSNLKQPISDYSFAYIYVWVNSFRLYWGTFYKHLCIFVIEDDLLHLYTPPLPEHDAAQEDLKKAVINCFRIMDDHNSQKGEPFAGTIHYVSDEMLDRISKCSIEGLVFSPSPMGGDYIYDMQKMISLSGQALASKRHARNKFLREHPDSRIVEIGPEHGSECLDLLRSWHMNGNKNLHDIHRPRDKYDNYRDLEMLSCEMAIKHWQDLDLKGIVLFAGEKLIGFTFGEILMPTQASIIIEKTHPDFPGSSTFIFSEFCRLCWPDLPECNAGDDGNIVNLRFTKQEYRPAKYLNKSIITHDRPLQE